MEGFGRISGDESATYIEDVQVDHPNIRLLSVAPTILTISFKLVKWGAICLLVAERPTMK